VPSQWIGVLRTLKMLLGDYALSGTRQEISPAFERQVAIWMKSILKNQHLSHEYLHLIFPVQTQPYFCVVTGRQRIRVTASGYNIGQSWVL